jgi:hypothetical protein
VNFQRVAPGDAYGSHVREVIGRDYGSGSNWQHPIGARYDGHGFDSHGIGFEEFNKMHSKTLHHGHYRRMPDPEWAFDNAKLRQLILVYLERRANTKARSGTDLERLAAIDAKLRSYEPGLSERLTRLCHELVELKKNPHENRARIRRVEVMCQNLDTEIRFNRRAAQFTVAVVHLYYRVRLDSVQTASEVKLGPCHIRLLLHNLNKCWDRMTGKISDKKSGRREKAPDKYVVTLTDSEGRAHEAVFDTMPAARQAVRTRKEKAPEGMPELGGDDGGRLRDVNAEDAADFGHCTV